MMRSALYYTNMLSWIFIVLAPWNNSGQIYQFHSLWLDSNPWFTTLEVSMLTITSPKFVKRLYIVHWIISLFVYKLLLWLSCWIPDKAMCVELSITIATFFCIFFIEHSLCELTVVEVSDIVWLYKSPVEPENKWNIYRNKTL